MAAETAPLVSAPPVSTRPPPRGVGADALAPPPVPDGKRSKMSVMMLGALGIVFGDIGTSPLYTLRECLGHFGPRDPIALHTSVLQVLSLIFWSLMVVVTIKYLVFIMKADNKGEGGIMALLALVPEKYRAGPLEKFSFVAVLVVVGASFLYGDGAITPAISVLSAVEGIAVARPELQNVVVPITIMILVGLFAIQSRGTGLIGQLFGPIMVVWFGTLAALGAWHIAHEPRVLEALSPHHAINYFVQHGVHGLLILGAVVLAVTGGEALYADMGHFATPKFAGVVPIRRAWLFFVLPALVLAYFGQGALVLRDATAIENPFFRMVPTGSATFALVVLSSIAAVIASQALISGSFSLTRQAMQMGFFPRVTIKHTADEEGQIYIPEINAFLGVVCIFLVLTFRSSSAMAAVYGVAVTGTMTITSIVYFMVVRTTRGWSFGKALALIALFLAFDIPFVIANAFKIPHGGWVPLFLGAIVVAVMLVWHEGRRLIGNIYSTRYASFEEAWSAISPKVSQRVGGVGVFLASADQGVPPILVHLVERTRSLHKTIVLLTVVTAEVPKVENRDRLRVEEIDHGFWRMHVYYGFKQQPDVPSALSLASRRKVLDVDIDDVTYYLARERILAKKGGEMGVIIESLFSFLQRNAVNADRYFRIPPSQVIEVGAQIDL
jgi:KUP system potassium uptake protein